MEVIQEKYYEWMEFYNWALTVSDPRVKDWLFMQAYTPTILLSLTYVFVVWIGQKIMANREPFKFRWTLVLYNFGLIALNFHICSQIVYHAYNLGYSIQCQPVVYSPDYHSVGMAKALWWFYFSKLVEMLDTIFFVLRKKNNQISFLHVYHHASMFPIWWMGIKWVAGGQSYFGAMINSFIHVVMYSYYGISAIGPHMQKYLWWKRYLTIIQLTQFFIGMVYGFQSLYLDCDFPKWMQYAGLVYGVTIITLFLNFYIQAYLKKKPVSQIQFLAGITHAVQSLVFKCDFPVWMQWALVFYGFSILMLFLNFYFHAYIKSMKAKKASGKGESKHTNGAIKENGVAKSNGHSETKKDK